MAVNSDHDADRRDQKDEPEGDPSVAGAKKLRACLRSDHAVDGEPSDREEQRQTRSEVGPAKTKDAAREDDLRQPRTRSGVAEQAEDERRRDRAQGGRKEPIPDADAVVGREQAGGEKARVVDEGARPQERELSR